MKALTVVLLVAVGVYSTDRSMAPTACELSTPTSQASASCDACPISAAFASIFNFPSPVSEELAMPACSLASSECETAIAACTAEPAATEVVVATSCCATSSKAGLLTQASAETAETCCEEVVAIEPVVAVPATP